MERLMENMVLIEDMEYIFKSLSEKEKDKLKNSKVLVTGCAGRKEIFMICLRRQK